MSGNNNQDDKKPDTKSEEKPRKRFPPTDPKHTTPEQDGVTKNDPKKTTD